MKDVYVKESAGVQFCSSGVFYTLHMMKPMQPPLPDCGFQHTLRFFPFPNFYFILNSVRPMLMSDI